MSAVLPTGAQGAEVWEEHHERVCSEKGRKPIGLLGKDIAFTRVMFKAF